MPCYSPLTGWRKKSRNPSGKYGITFTKSEGFADKELTVPCGKCIGCRLEHSRQWAVRCMHEASQHEDNCFVTLTYNDEKIPKVFNTPTLLKSDVQKFIKRLRNEYGSGIKYYLCGEYGEQNLRPHYHLCLFGIDFEDKEIFFVKNENKIYTSEKLDSLWTDPDDQKSYGFSTVGQLTFETAAYTARYCLKKWKGKDWQKHYEIINEETGEIKMQQPEFALMSRRPGVGKNWFDQFQEELTTNDSVIVRGKEMKPPRYYDKQIEKENLKKYEMLKLERKAAIEKSVLDNSLARLHVKGIVKQAQIKQLKKEL